ncbi:MAG TPA: alpha/beta hydrolase [Asticcacaulis sp.]|nr:alpha/beta hydrolase [Asticcacaulis sp.]
MKIAMKPLLFGLAAILLFSCKKEAVPAPTDPAQVVKGATLKTVAYGPDPDQTMDIYAPPGAKAAPLLLIVHGGGWREGNKASPGVVGNKLIRWLPQDYILVSIDYGLLPKTPVDTQARNIAKAVAYTETHASEWGGDGTRLILMGHSAGAHMVALLSADPSQVVTEGGKPWRGTVVLDSGSPDLVAVMNGRPGKVYREAFGTDPAYWARLSPLQHLRPGAVPMLLVCSIKRRACGQSAAFAARIKSIGGDAQVLPEDLTHMEINDNLGQPGAYTDAVDAFIAARLK